MIVSLLFFFFDYFFIYPVYAQNDDLIGSKKNFSQQTIDVYFTQNNNHLKDCYFHLNGVLNIQFKKDMHKFLISYSENPNSFDIDNIKKKIFNTQRHENYILKNHFKDRFISKDFFQDHNHPFNGFFIYNFSLQGKNDSQSVKNLLHELTCELNFDAEMSRLDRYAVFNGYNTDTYGICSFKIKNNPPGLYTFYFYGGEREKINNQYLFSELFRKNQDVQFVYLFWIDSEYYYSYFQFLKEIPNILNNFDNFFTFNDKELILLEKLNFYQKDLTDAKDQIVYLNQKLQNYFTFFQEYQNKIKTLNLPIKNSDITIITNEKKNSLSKFLNTPKNSNCYLEKTNFQDEACSSKSEISSIKQINPKKIFKIVDSKEVMHLPNFISDHNYITNMTLQYLKEKEKYYQSIVNFKKTAIIKPDIEYSFQDFLHILSLCKNIYYALPLEKIVISISHPFMPKEEQIAISKIQITLVNSLSSIKNIKIQNTKYRDYSLKFQSNVFLSLEPPINKPRIPEILLISNTKSH